MNQQMSSTHQISSSTITPGGGGGVFKTTSKIYQTREEYQYEQQFGGSQVKSVPIQQDHRMEQQFFRQQDLQKPFSEFQIPIQPGYQQNLQQQHSEQTFRSHNIIGQSQFQRPQQQQQQQQQQFPPDKNVQYQNIPSQGQRQSAPQNQARFQPQSAQQSKPSNISQDNQSQKQVRFTGSQPFQPTLQKGNLNFQQSQQATEWPPKNEGGPNLTTTYPSGFKLKEEAPMEHTSGISVVPSQPAFKITQPVKVRGDDKWPPKKYTEDVTQEEVREFIKPKKGNRDYTEFFAQNALPSSYPSYRAPPGTQHRGLEE